MKKKQITILTILTLFITLLFVFSLSTISAADQTIDNSTGISTGITNTGNEETLTLQEGIYNKSTDRGITINKNITIQGNTSTNNVIIDAQGLTRIFTISNNRNVVFINLTFINGYTTANGGAIYNNYANSKITFINCNFINNTANNGGVIYNVGNSLLVFNSTFTDNILLSNYGGAIYNSGSDFSVSDSTFENNVAGSRGGAIYNNGGNSFSVVNSTFIDNSANQGGAIYNNGIDFSVSNSAFTSNIALSNSGGAIYNSGSDFSVSNSTFIGNNASFDGGAIYNSGTNSSVSDSTFKNNTAYNYGGAIRNSGGNVSVINLTFIDNFANRGGAIYNTGGNSSVSDSTFIGNNATIHGGAIYNVGSNFFVNDSIFTSNIALSNSGGAIYNSGSDFSVSNSAFENNVAGIRGGAIYNYVGSDFSVSDSTFTSNIIVSTGSGGAIYNYGGSDFSVSDSTFIGNNATSSGGAIFNYRGYDFSVNNSNFMDNKANNGGAISSSTGNFYISNSIFKNNTAYNYGGAIRNSGGNVSVINLTFIDNFANRGGAIYNTGGNSSVSDSTFIGNNATIHGGAIYNVGSNFFVNDSIFTSNIALSNSGGAIYNSGINSSVNNSTFTYNFANRGGAIYNSGSDFSVSDSAFENNFAGIRGGAIYNYVGSDFFVSGSTFTDNSANQGGAIYNANGGMFVVGNVMSGNTAVSSGPMIYNAGHMGILNLTFLNNMTVLVDSGSVILYALLTDDMGNTVSGQRIYFYVDGTLVGSASSDKNGEARISFTVPNSLRPSIVPVTGDYAGRDGYNINIRGGELDLPVITKLETKSTINVTSVVKVGQNININGIATDENDNPLVNIIVNVTVDGQIFYVTTDEFGYWNLSYVALEVGDFNIMVQWAGNTTHTSFVNITELDVIPFVTNSTVNVSSNSKVGQNITISGVATDEYGNPIANTIIQVTIEYDEENSWFFNVITDIDGFWTLNFTPANAGNFVVAVFWNGNTTHLEFTNTTTFNVAKAIANSTIVVSNGKIGQTTTIFGVAKDENGNPLAEIDIIVTINGQSYTVTTDNNGAWSLSYTPSVSGNLSVVVTWAGSADHLSFTNSTIFNVANLTTNSTIAVVNITVGKSTTINGTAIDENGNPLANVQLTVTVNGIAYTVNTDASGFWSLSYIPNVVGSLNVQVNWTGNSTHDGFINVTFLNVSRAATNSTIVVVNSTVGKSTTINGTAIDENGNPLANVQLNVTVNGVVYSVTTNNLGFWSLSYIPNVAGSLNLQVNWTGNATHNGFTNVTVLNVSKAVTNSTIGVSGSIVGKNVTINGTAIDENGNPLVGVTLNVTVNGVVHSVVTNGVGFWNLTYVANASGVFNVQVSYLGNSTHFNFVNVTNFNIANASTNSTINAPTGKISQQTNITGVATDENGNVLVGITITVTVDGISYTVTTNSTGGWSLTYTPTVSGNLNITVTWNGNSTHNGFTNATVLSVANASSNSTISAPNGKVSQQSNITGVATDENGNVLVGITITVTVNGVNYSVTTSSTGGWSLLYTPNISGDLNIMVSWVGNATHVGFTNSTVFNVANLTTNSTINVVNSTVGKSTTLNGTATDENGNQLVNVQLTVTVNGVNYSVTTNGVGFWILTYIPNTSGSLDVQVNWTGNSTHNGFTNTTVLNVSRAATNSTINTPNGKIGQQSTINGVAIDENGNLLANIQLTVTVDGTSYTVNTNNAGAWILNIIPTASGNLSVVVTWAGNATHVGFTNSTVFSVANAGSNSTINDPNGKVGQSMNITGVATDENGNVLVNVQINVTVNGTSYNVTTNNSGVWSLNYTPSVSGNLDVVVSWAGNGTHNSFTNATVFTVVNASSNSTIVVPNGNAGQSMNITGVALDDNGNPLAGVQLTVVIDGSSYNVTTDGVGAWSIIFTPGREGLFDLSLSWAGNSTHNGFTNDTVFSVPKIPTNSTINAPNTKVGEQSTISGVALDDNGNPLTGITITITVDGTVYNVTTDSTGVWSLNITLINSGSLNVVVSWIGNNTHHGFSNLTVFVVAKLATNSSVIVSNATVGKSTIIRGVLADENNKPIVGANLTVIVDGKSFNVITGADGSWNLSYTLLKAGKLTIKVDYLGNSNYLASTNSTVLTVSEGPVNPVKPDIRFIKRTNKKSIKNGKKVIMKYLTYKNFGGSGSQNLSAQVLFKNFKYKVLNKIKLQYAKNKVKFKVTLKSGGTFTLKIKTYKSIKAKT